jgi:hypothetical protein
MQKTRRAAWFIAMALGMGLSAGCGAHATHGSPTPALGDVKQTLSLNGPNGLRVEVVDYDRDVSLIRVLGADNALTGKVLAYERSRNNDRLSYQTKWHGRALYALVKDRDGRYRAFLPGERDEIGLSYSEDQSAAIDAQAIQRLHRAQAERGELEPLQRFDRAGEQRDHEEALASESARIAKTCGTKPLPARIDWKTVSDAQILEYSVSSYCESALGALGRACEHDAGKRFAAQLSALECRLDGDNTLALAGSTLRWNINFELANASDVAYEGLLAQIPAGAQTTLGKQLIAEQTAVCSDDAHQRVVLVGPREAPHGGLAYGDGKRFYLIRTPPMLGGGWFFSPRQRNDAHNDNFRGLDLRVFSFVEPDAAKGTCKLSCGTRDTQLTLLKGPAKDALLAQATYEPSPHTREPYALARDKSGTYYFVDRGNTDETARDFRLYRGKRGQLRPLAMKDVVSDSEGEVFASKSGSLRLVVGKQSAQWIAGGTSTLLLLPINENLGLIYNELGVYLSERLGIPCDDF